METLPKFGISRADMMKRVGKFCMNTRFLINPPSRADGLVPWIWRYGVSPRSRHSWRRMSAAWQLGWRVTESVRCCLPHSRERFALSQSPNQWLKVLINQNPSIANHTSAKMPASRISRRVSGAPEAMRSTLSSRPSGPGSVTRSL
jgi:hypothetical protein